MNILIVDDSKSVHAYIKGLLAEKEFTIDSAYDGEEGLEKIKGGSYELILLDVEMPKLTGHEVLKEVRSFNDDLPVIMVTSRNRPSEIQSLIEAGADEYVMKPFTLDILINKMEDVLEREIG
jgi:DNA-binding response OmpR family regulator